MRDHVKGLAEVQVDDIHPRVLKEMADMMKSGSATTSEKSWLSGEVLMTGKRETFLPFLRKGDRKMQGTTGQ